MAKSDIKRWALLDFRNSQRMTQAEFAKKLGYNKSTYALVETGKRNGTQEFWSRLQNEFGVADDDMWRLTKIEEK